MPTDVPDFDPLPEWPSAGATRRFRSASRRFRPTGEQGWVARPGGGLLRWVLWPLLKWGLIAALPFWALLRGSLFAYHHQWPTSLALLAGFATAFLVLLGYAIWGHVWSKGTEAAYRTRALRWKALGVLVVLGLFQGYVLLAPNPAHVKSEEVHGEYTELHPTLRMSVATLLLVDEGVLITDLFRHPSDYEDMGLSVNPQSLHYRQANGYVHALDLRTKGHYEIRNRLMQGYFAALGFRTLRHVGTADHLHVALPLPTGRQNGAGALFESRKMPAEDYRSTKSSRSTAVLGKQSGRSASPVTSVTSSCCASATYAQSYAEWPVASTRRRTSAVETSYALSVMSASAFRAALRASARVM
jgi:hypothetical protein